jgi:hypothetical protein
MTTWNVGSVTHKVNQLHRELTDSERKSNKLVKLMKHYKYTYQNKKAYKSYSKTDKGKLKQWETHVEENWLA